LIKLIKAILLSGVPQIFLNAKSLVGRIPSGSMEGPPGSQQSGWLFHERFGQISLDEQMCGCQAIIGIVRFVVKCTVQGGGGIVGSESVLPATGID
jgi:hypothetical protein